uniref:Agenet domain-containing protein n=1 Tax=Oryza meridionalis TaxID=40149 RepID=A0A0E0E3K8_9ORYZ
MKLVKGSKVEVLQEAEVPLGSWRGAEIVLGNGQSFYVRYDPSPVDSCAAVERVQRRLIRPCPPRDDSVCWAVGDILEAFDSYSWKIAEMVRVLGKDFYLVRLLGSSLELRTHASELRLRKHWKDGKWTVLQKDSTKCFGGSFRGQPKSGILGSNFGKQAKLGYCAMGNNLLLKNQKALEGDKSRGMKRKSSAITHPTQCSEVTRGMKRLQTPHRDGRHAALVAGVSPRPKSEACKASFCRSMSMEESATWFAKLQRDLQSEYDLQRLCKRPYFKMLHKDSGGSHAKRVMVSV